MSKAKPISILEFMQQFPTDDACLEHLMAVRFGRESTCPKCLRDTKFHRVTGRPVFSCQFCAHQISPMAGTPFAKSSTPLQKWFYAIYLFTSSRHGVPAKELQRQLSVTYKTAWRMGHEIRQYMADVDGDNDLSGHVEIDEAYIGGKDKVLGRPTAKNSKKTGVLGMVQRGGEIITRVIPDVKRDTVMPHIVEHIEEGSTISTDELHTYRTLPAHGYEHGVVHHAKKNWKTGKHHTNTIEGFWGRLKLSIKGTHVHVSRKYLPNYLAEFEYRFNNRKRPEQMFGELMQSF